MTDSRFQDTRLPDYISLGAIGGPQFKTTIVSLGSGFEKANQDWSLAACKYDIGHVAKDQATFDATRAFFYAMRGRFYAFRFKDHSDYKLGSSSAPVAIGVGDGLNTFFQFIKPYTFGGYTYDRTLRAIVSGTYGVLVDGTPLVEGAGAGKFTLDKPSGLITLGTAAGSTKIVSAYCQFDVVVRFDTDWGNFSTDIGDAKGTGVQSWPQIPLVEYRLKV